jgi:hypothetical protein
MEAARVKQATHVWSCEDCAFRTEDNWEASEHRETFSGHTVERVQRQTGLDQEWST